MKGLRRMRLERGMTLQELAKVLGVTLTSIHCYEAGKRDPSLKTLKKMAKFFGCKIDDLL